MEEPAVMNIWRCPWVIGWRYMLNRHRNVFSMVCFLMTPVCCVFLMFLRCTWMHSQFCQWFWTHRGSRQWRSIPANQCLGPSEIPVWDERKCWRIWRGAILQLSSLCWVGKPYLFDRHLAFSWHCITMLFNRIMRALVNVDCTSAGIVQLDGFSMFWTKQCCNAFLCGQDFVALQARLWRSGSYVNQTIIARTHADRRRWQRRWQLTAPRCLDQCHKSSI